VRGLVRNDGAGSGIRSPERKPQRQWMTVVGARLHVSDHASAHLPCLAGGGGPVRRDSCGVYRNSQDWPARVAGARLDNTNDANPTLPTCEGFAL
jgi:hypothetical protein